MNEIETHDPYIADRANELRSVLSDWPSDQRPAFKIEGRGDGPYKLIWSHFYFANVEDMVCRTVADLDAALLSALVLIRMLDHFRD